jgi:hypothetical protein
MGQKLIVAQSGDTVVVAAEHMCGDAMAAPQRGARDTAVAHGKIVAEQDDTGAQFVAGVDSSSVLARDTH